MKPTKTLRLLVLVFALVHLCMAIIGDEIYSIGFRSVALIFLTALYLINIESINLWFLGFLILYAIGDLFSFVTWFTNPEQSVEIDLINYYIGNTIYIVSYLLLALRIFISLHFKEIIKNQIPYVVLLTVLSIFCVYFVSEATMEFIDSSAYLMESIYNTTVIILMSLALLGYLTHDDKKSINLLIGSIFIVFSEILQLAYFYVAEFQILYFICSILFVLAFLFFYLQSRLEYRNHIEYNYDI